MIQLTRLNNSAITINSDLIKSAEASPDTVITLLNGEKIIVREAVSELVTRVVDFRRRVRWRGLRTGRRPWQSKKNCRLNASVNHEDVRQS